MIYQDLLSNAANSNYTIVDKNWGREIWIVNNENYCSKLLLLQGKKRCSIHSHKKKIESFLLISGCVYMEYGSESKFMHPGDIVHISRELTHRFTGVNGISEIMEISTHHKEEDSYRITESGDVPDNTWKEIREKYDKSYGDV